MRDEGRGWNLYTSICEQPDAVVCVLFASAILKHFPMCGFAVGGALNSSCFHR